MSEQKAGTPETKMLCCSLWFRLFKWFFIIFFCIKKKNTGGILAEEMFILVNGASVSMKPFKFNLFFFFFACIQYRYNICGVFLGGI